jgi:hypothetical protein
VDEFIEQVRRADPELGESLVKKRAHWAKQLGAPGADTTVQQAQQLKEDHYEIISSSAIARPPNQARW